MTRPISHTRAIVYTIVGYTIWVLGDTCTKLAGQAHLPPSQIIVFSGFFSMLTLFIASALRRRIRCLVPQQWKKELLRAVLYILLSFINITCFTQFPLAVVYAVMFSMPLWVAMAAAVLMHEALSWRLGLAILAGFGGVLLAVDITGHNFGTAQPWLLVALAAFPVLGAANTLFVRYLGRKEHVESMSFIPQTARVLFVLPFFFWQFEPVSFETLSYMAGLGLASGLGQLLVVAAIKYAPAAIVTPFSYSQIISGALIGYLIWNDVPSTQLVVGSVVIILSGLYIARHARRLEARAMVAV